MRPNLVAGVEISNFLSANLAPFFTLDLITFFSMPFVFDNPDVVTVSQFRKKGFINDVSFYGSSFLGQLSSPAEFITGLGVGTVAKSGVKTLAKMTVTGGRSKIRALGFHKLFNFSVV
jgi:hypothetical protein